jgi:hypothetical protein
MSNSLYFNYTTMAVFDKKQKWFSYFDLPRKKLIRKRVFMYYFKYKYPFSLNHNKNIIESLNFFNKSNIQNYIKIIKKYNFLKNTKIINQSRSYKHLLNKSNLLLDMYKYKINKFNKPFFKKIFYKKLKLVGKRKNKINKEKSNF